MNDIFIIYKTDNWHSYNSRDLIGVVTTQNKVIELCKKQAKKEGYKLSEDDLFNLNNIKQTQGYAGEGEFHYEPVTKNKLL